MQGNREGNRNTAVGAKALSLSALSLGDDNNTAVGYGAFIGDASKASSVSPARRGGGAACVGLSENTAVGAFALASGQGCGNTMIGSGAGKNNGSAGNTFIGFQAGLNTIDGSENTGIGDAVLINNLSGSTNCAVGSGALSMLENGDNNVAVGGVALVSLIDGNDNVAIGFRAGNFLREGSNNIYLGTKNDLISPIVQEDSTIRIGTPNLQSALFAAGIFGQKVEGESFPVFVNADGKLGTIRTIRMPKSEQNEREILSKLLSLNVLSVDGQENRYDTLAIDKVAEVFPELIIYDDSGTPSAIRYDLFVLFCLAAMQRMTAREAKIEERIAKIESTFLSFEQSAYCFTNLNEN